MAKENDWVILKASKVSWMFTTIYQEAAALLNCAEEEVAKVHPNLRKIVFLDRGPGRLRMVPLFNSMELVQREIQGTVATSQINIRNAVRLSGAVAKHLGLAIYPKGERGFDTEDTVAFLAPRREYEAYAQALKDGKPFHAADLGHVYLAKASFRGSWTWPPVEELEALGKRQAVKVPA